MVFGSLLMSENSLNISASDWFCLSNGCINVRYKLKRMSPTTICVDIAAGFAPGRGVYHLISATYLLFFAWLLATLRVGTNCM